MLRLLDLFNDRSKHAHHQQTELAEFWGDRADFLGQANEALALSHPHQELAPPTGSAGLQPDAEHVHRAGQHPPHPRELRGKHRTVSSQRYFGLGDLDVHRSHLRGDKVGVDLAKCDKAFMIASFDDLAAAQHNDFVCVPDR